MTRTSMPRSAMAARTADQRRSSSRFEIGLISRSAKSDMPRSYRRGGHDTSDPPPKFASSTRLRADVGGSLLVFDTLHPRANAFLAHFGSPALPMPSKYLSLALCVYPTRRAMVVIEQSRSIANI